MEKDIDRVRKKWREYRRLQDRLDQLTALAEKATANLSGMPGSGYSPKDDVWAMLADCRIQYEEQIRDYLRESERLEKELRCIHNDNIRTACMYRYIHCLTVEEVAERMEVDRSTAYRLLDKGRSIYYAQV